MAAAAQRRRQIIGVLHDQRHMRLMAAQAVLIGHIAGMRRMALVAGGSLAVGTMTFLAVKLRVQAGIGGHFLAGAGVAGDADGLHRSNLRKIHRHGIMRIVAGLAILQGIMGLFAPIMAHAAFRDSVTSHGRMFQVAILASYFRLVFSTLGVDISHGLHMAFNTIFVFKRNNMLTVLISGHGCSGEHQGDAEDHQCKLFHFSSLCHVVSL